MAPASKSQPQARKRTRKRKRRVASSSDSSSDSDSSSSSDSPAQTITVKIPVKQPVQETPTSEESESDSESSSESESSRPPSPGAKEATVFPEADKQPRRPRSPSPELAPVPIPSFLPDTTTTENQQREEQLKERFRKFWMASVADAFKSDLEGIQKEPNMTKSRLAILIDSLASGADVFSSTSNSTSSPGINEMEVVLGES